MAPKTSNKKTEMANTLLQRANGYKISANQAGNENGFGYILIANRIYESLKKNKESNKLEIVQKYFTSREYNDFSANYQETTEIIDRAAVNIRSNILAVLSIAESGLKYFTNDINLWDYYTEEKKTWEKVIDKKPSDQ
jgi:hypothetical protein